MTNQQGAPEALRPIARYKIGYATDDWGMRSSTPSGIPDLMGAWVRYEDHIAALVEAQQPAPSAAAAPDGWESVIYEIRSGLVDSEPSGYDNSGYRSFAGTVLDAVEDGLLKLAAPQQEAQEPAAYIHVPHHTVEGEVRPVVSFEKYQQDYADGIYSTRIPLYTAPQPSPTPQADSQPALDRARIREIFMAHGFTVKEGQTDLKQYVYDAAEALLRAARAPADSVLEDAARLEQIAEAIRDYHHALDLRKHGGLAESVAFNSICQTMGMHWNRGEEAARRAARKQGASHD